MEKISNDGLGRPSPEEFASMDKMPVTVVLDNVRSMNNVGSFFRTCDAFAAERIILCGITGTPPDKEIHKTALGAELTVPWEYCRQTEESLAALKERGYTLVVAEQVKGAATLSRFPVEKGRKYAVVFGNEVSGVSQQAVDMCDMAVEIPQAGTKHSLNVAVSGGVVLWRFFEFFSI